MNVAETAGKGNSRGVHREEEEEEEEWEEDCFCSDRNVVLSP